MMTMLQFLTTEIPAPVRTVVKKFVDTSQWMRVLQWETKAQAFFPVNRQTALPTTTSRAVGEAYTHSNSVIEPSAEPLKIYGGVHQFDAFQVATGSGSRRALEMEAFVESVMRNVERDLIKGDTTSDPRDLRGLQQRLTGNQLVNNHATGAGLVIAKALEAKRATRNPTHWLMNETIRDLIVLAAHDTTVAGYVTRRNNEIGQDVAVFCELPIVVIGQDAADADILPFSEAGSGGGTTNTSIYCVSHRPDRLHGIQAAQVRAEDLGKNPTNGVQFNAIVEWYPGLMLEHERSATRLRGISNAAVTRV